MIYYHLFQIVSKNSLDYHPKFRLESNLLGKLNSELLSELNFELDFGLSDELENEINS